MVREGFPDVHIIENDENLGFARANNQAIPRSTGRYILLLNPDTEVAPGALETLVRFMDDCHQVGAAGPRLIDSDGTLQLSCHPEPTLAREFWRLFHLDTLRAYSRYPSSRWQTDVPIEVDAVQGACMILRRAALDYTGLLDEDYFIYSEEVDLCTRLRRRGWMIFWVPGSIVMHIGGQSTRQVAAAMFLRLYQAKVLYFRKHGASGAATVYKIILAASALGRLSISPLAWLESPARRRAHLMLIARYWQLLWSLWGW